MAQAKVKRMFAVESNMLLKVGFDHLTPGEGHGYMAVQFTNFDVWGYANVAYTDFLYVLNAVSVGQAFNATIKPKYKGEKLSANDTHVVAAGTTATKEQPKKEEDAPMFDVLDSSEKTTKPRRKK